MASPVNNSAHLISQLKNLKLMLTTNLVVSDVGRSLNFYSDVVGMKQVMRPNFDRYLCTSISFSEALILAATNPQNDKILFIDLPVQCMKTKSSEHVVYKNCFECQNKKTICLHNMF